MELWQQLNFIVMYLQFDCIVFQYSMLCNMPWHVEENSNLNKWLTKNKLKCLQQFTRIFRNSGKWAPLTSPSFYKKKCSDHSKHQYINSTIRGYIFLVIPLWSTLMDIYWSVCNAYEVEQYKILVMPSTQLKHHFVNIIVGMY